jgi:hypothetical protein
MKRENWGTRTIIGAVAIALAIILVMVCAALTVYAFKADKPQEVAPQEITVKLQEGKPDIIINKPCTEILDQSAFRYLDNTTIPGDAKPWTQDGAKGYDYSIGMIHYRVVLGKIEYMDLNKYGPFIYMGDDHELDTLEGY